MIDTDIDLSGYRETCGLGTKQIQKLTRERDEALEALDEMSSLVSECLQNMNDTALTLKINERQAAIRNPTKDNPNE